ncbi:MAG: glycine cleavage system protein GcvH, partial [Enterovibrio sp.]
MYDIPQDLQYTTEHGWVRNESDGIVTIGLTDFAQKQLGAIESVDLIDENEHVDSGSEYGSIEASKSYNEILSCISGEIVAINEDVIDQPQLINSDPYGDGWLVQIRLDDTRELDDLLDANSYLLLLQDEELIDEDE